MPAYNLHQRAASLIANAGGELVGRTRLQKVAYLSQLAGFSDDFDFEYRHYGPFSDDLAEAMKLATGLKLVIEEERKTDWGGWYSVFKALVASDTTDATYRNFLSAAAKVGAIELELAATAAFLSKEGAVDPWAETAKRKPEKAADGRLELAKEAYRKLRKLPSPSPLPAIA
jgi:uncharacterized protein YwgA